jgi:hypothetical protein
MLSFQNEKQLLFFCWLVLISEILYAQETVYTTTKTNVSKKTDYIRGLKADHSIRFDYTLNADQDEIEVQISSYLDEYTLTGWKASNPDCQTPNNICQEVKIESLLKMTLKAKLVKKER